MRWIRRYDHRNDPQSIPIADFSDPTWGQVDTPEFSIEIQLGEEKLVRSETLAVRGGYTAAGCVADITQRLGCRASDTWTGDFFDPENATAGSRRWRAYRDNMMASEPKDALGEVQNVATSW